MMVRRSLAPPRVEGRAESPRDCMTERDGRGAVPGETAAGTAALDQPAPSDGVGEHSHRDGPPIGAELVLPSPTGEPSNRTDQIDAGSTSNVSTDDELRLQQRRERNRLAAARCRDRRRHRAAELVQESDELENRNEHLMKDITQLEEEKQKLEETLRIHLLNCKQQERRLQPEQQQQQQLLLKPQQLQQQQQQQKREHLPPEQIQFGPRPGPLSHYPQQQEQMHQQQQQQQQQQLDYNLRIQHQLQPCEQQQQQQQQQQFHSVKQQLSRPTVQLTPTIDTIVKQAQNHPPSHQYC